MNIVINNQLINKNFNKNKKNKKINNNYKIHNNNQAKPKTVNY